MSLGLPDTSRARIEPRADSLPKGLEDRLNIDVHLVRPLHWREGQITPLYYIEAEQGRFVLKLSTPRSRWGPVATYLASQEIAHQARVYRCLAAASHRYLRVPRLVTSDERSFLLLDYVETRGHGEHDLPREALLHSLLEFQLTTEGLQLPFLPAAVRSNPAVLVRRLLGGMRKLLGRNGVRRSLEVIAGCYRSQPRLPRYLLRHNDFHHRNVMLGTQGDLYLTDFEYVSLDARWVLGDIIYFAVGTGCFFIDKELIMEYASLLQERAAIELDLSAQLRFGLMLRLANTILGGSAPKSVSAAYQRFFEEVLLDDEQYLNWLSADQPSRVSTSRILN